MPAHPPCQACSGRSTTALESPGRTWKALLQRPRKALDDLTSPWRSLGDLHRRTVKAPWQVSDDFTSPWKASEDLGRPRKALPQCPLNALDELRSPWKSLQGRHRRPGKVFCCCVGADRRATKLCQQGWTRRTTTLLASRRRVGHRPQKKPRNDTAERHRPASKQMRAGRAGRATPI